MTISKNAWSQFWHSDWTEWRLYKVSNCRQKQRSDNRQPAGHNWRQLNCLLILRCGYQSENKVSKDRVTQPREEHDTSPAGLNVICDKYAHTTNSWWLRALWPIISDYFITSHVLRAEAEQKAAIDMNREHANSETGRRISQDVLRVRGVRCAWPFYLSSLKSIICFSLIICSSFIYKLSQSPKTALIDISFLWVTLD